MTVVQPDPGRYDDDWTVNEAWATDIRGDESSCDRRNTVTGWGGRDVCSRSGYDSASSITTREQGGLAASLTQQTLLSDHGPESGSQD